MGLIRGTVNAVKGVASSATGGFVGAVGGVLGQAMHQEYFTSGSMAGDILMKRAEQVKPNGSKNNGNDANVITNGSLIDVQSNQCMIIVENGKVVEACMEPGRFIYDTTLAPSFFAGEGKFSEKIKGVAKEIWEQTKMGGQRKNTQRIYFINIGILDESIKWGVGNVQFQHTEQLGAGGAPLGVGVTLKGHGLARIRIERPLDFYELYGAKYAGGDNSVVITIASLNTFFESSRNKIIEAIATAITELGMRKPVRYNEIMTSANMKELREMVNAFMAESDLYKIGFDFYEFSVGGSGFILNDEDRETIKQLQIRAFEASNINLANYTIQSKMAEGFQEAGKNGGVAGIMGMGVAMGGGLGSLGNMQAQPVPQQGVVPQQPMQTAVASPASPASPQADTWKCSCGNIVSGNFCSQCGSKRPEPQAPVIWTCSCGRTNDGLFCPNCGTKRPEVKKKIVCDKCGWESEDMSIRFCPNCGDSITEADVK